MSGPDEIVPPHAAEQTSSAAQPPEIPPKKRGWLKSFSDSTGSWGLAVTLMLFAGGIATAWYTGLSGVRKELREEFEKKLDDAGKRTEALAAENARLARYLEANQESALDQFYWVCLQKKGLIDRNQKICTYPDLQIVQRFTSLNAQGSAAGSP